MALRKGVVALKTPKMKRKKKHNYHVGPVAVNPDLGLNSGMSQPM